MDRQIASLDPNVNPVPLPIMAISGPSYPPRHHPHLGRGLMNPNPDSDRGKLDEGEVIGGKLVATGGNTPALLDLVKDSLDEIT